MFYLSFKSDLNRARVKIDSIKSKVVSTKYGLVEYIKLGKGIPILISHGMTGGVDQGLGMANDFISKKYETIVVSRFGYLKSTLPKNSTPEAQADAYIELLDHLKIQKVIVFGNSAGGTSAIKFALKYSNRCMGLILHSSNVPLDKAIFVPPKIFMKIMFGSNLIYWLTTKYFINLIMLMFVPRSIQKQLNKKQLSYVQKVFTSSLPITLRTAGILNDAYISNPDINTGYSFNKISVPTLVIHAKDDPVAKFEGAERIAKIIPNCDFNIIEKGGHLTLGSEDKIKKTINRFIQVKLKEK